MRTLPPRPTSVTIVEAVEHEKGQVALWFDVDGHILAGQISWKGIETRKLRYGLARLDQEFRDAHLVSETVVDLVPDAEARAIAYFLEETFDRLETHEVDWRGHSAPDRFSSTGLLPDHVAHPQLHAKHVINERAPKSFEVRPHTRKVFKRSRPLGLFPYPTLPDVVERVLDLEGA